MVHVLTRSTGGMKKFKHVELVELERDNSRVYVQSEAKRERIELAEGDSIVISVEESSDGRDDQTVG